MRTVLLLCAFAVFRCDAVPVAGTFVQRKHLKDVDVTLTSRGTFVFDEGRCFTWRTEKPVPSVFHATPTNYTVTAAGRTTVYPLNTDVTSFEKVFEIKEVKDLIERIDVKRGGKRITPRPGDVPDAVEILFRNGDELKIELKQKQSKE